MSANSVYLEKHGWNCVSRKRRGMFIIMKWWKLGQGTNTQEDALRIQRVLNKVHKERKEAA